MNNKLIEYFNGDELAAKVWLNKYAMKDSFGNIYEKTPDDMHKRLAKDIARIEKNYPNSLSEETIYELLKHFKYIIPQGGPMSGIGNDYQKISLSNCFVIGTEHDSYGSIFLADQEQVQLMKRRGGVGHDLSHIRPAGSPVSNSALTSTGIVPFMERYSNSTREVAQDGRRGALMLTISIKHPDVENFIDAKMESNKVTGANVSVKIDDEFMEAVVRDTDYVQQFPIDSEFPVITKTIKARKLWKKIIHNAWKSAEPGVLFWDTVSKEAISDCYKEFGFKTVSTNPCGEIPLCPYDSCRLIAINLYSYVENPFRKNAKFNFELFKDHVNKAQRIMDSIVDLEIEKIDAILKKIADDPEPSNIKNIEIELWLKIKQKAIEGRRTGTGITGEGDMLAALSLRYGSDEAIKFSEDVHKELALNAYSTSVDMAKERGMFPIWDYEKEKNNPFIQRLVKEDLELAEKMKKYGRRNISLLTIAPTGTTSLMTQTTSGIEPVFMPYYKRRRKINPNEKGSKPIFRDNSGDVWEEYKVFHPKFELWYDLNWYKIKSEWYNLNTKLSLDLLSEEDLKLVYEKSPYYKATANDVDWNQKVKMQGIIQKWIDHSISVTVNLPKIASKELVDTLYTEAWKSGCKGLTIYREGSRDGVLVKNKDTKPKESKQKKRPKTLKADVIRFQNNKEKWIAFVGIKDNRPYEIFTGKLDPDEFYVPVKVKEGTITKTTDDKGEKIYNFNFEYKRRSRHIKDEIYAVNDVFNAEYWNYAKLVSGILRHNMSLEYVIKLIKGLELKDGLLTWKNGIIRALKKYIKDGTKAKGEKCPQCGSNNLIYQEGCLICKSCGNSKCE